MNTRLVAVTILAVVSLMASLMGGCALSRYDQLQRKSDKVESALKSEQKRVLDLNADSTRQARLDHLSDLRLSLSATDIGLSTVKYAVPVDEQDLAYDVIEQVYDTIDWNIPLGPTEAKRPMPAQFTNGKLNLNNLRSNMAPAGQSPATPGIR
ncbi:MAG: hypothetical protein KGS45_05670 [Planctomycetes bacterium]|nr:hypothetical protein [Planctomycetota bacterium]